MSGLLHVLAGNALVAGTGSLLLLACGRRLRRRPALLHACWLLLLVKLIAPPLVGLPVLRAPAPSATAGDAAPTASGGLALGRDDVDPAPDYAAPAPGVGASAVLESAEPVEEATRAAPATPREPFDWERLVLAVWAAGAVLAAWRTGRRVFSLRKLLRSTEPAAPHLTARLARTAARLGLRRVPALRLLDARTSPFLAAPGTRAVMVFPRAVVDRVGGREIETLMIHELAHFARRDHLVRWIELVSEVVHWWNPVAPLVRRELRRAEEECCDAWVTSSLPGSSRPYAKALLACIDYMSGAELHVAAATAVGRLASLKRRVKMIMEGENSGHMARSSRLCLLLAAALLLPVAPTWAQTVEVTEDGFRAVPDRAGDRMREDDEPADLRKLARIVEKLANRGDDEMARDLEGIRTRMEARRERRLARRPLARKRADRDDALASRVDRLERGFNDMRVWLEHVVGARRERDDREQQSDADARHRVNLEAAADALSRQLAEVTDQIAELHEAGDVDGAVDARRRAAELESRLARLQAELSDVRVSRRSTHRRRAKELAEHVGAIKARIAELERSAVEHRARGESEAARGDLERLRRLQEELMQLAPDRSYSK